MTGYFEESPGTKSITRVAFAAGLLWAALLTTIFVIKGAAVGEIIALFTSLSGVFIGLKLIQKPMESPITTQPQTQQPNENPNPVTPPADRSGAAN